MKRVLFVCVENSNRSQMAEAFARFAKMREDLASRGRSLPGLLPLANLRLEVSRLLPAVFSEPDVAAAGGARKRKLLPDPRQQFGPGNP